MSVATRFTIADLERMPDDGMHREILDGELIELPPPKLDYSLVASQLAESLMMYCKTSRNLKVLVEAGYKLTGDGRNWLQPDVSIVSTARALQTGQDEYFEGAPEVAFEIISPSDLAEDVVGKTNFYLEAGAKSVVIIYPKQRSLTVHLPDGSSRSLADEPLRVPGVLPDWEIGASELFGELL